jgi:NAD(P)-dependent dehydrogenase (short-subunit alcohol dehydrogenase family)
MGAEIARRLAEEGAAVSIVGRDEARLTASLDAITSDGAEALAVRADITEADEIQRVVDETIGRFGKLDILVNAAGIFRPALIDDASKTFAEEWRINVVAPYELTRLALPHLRGRRGSVLFITSVSGKKAFPEASGYCTTKGAVEMLVRALAVEEAPNGVRVNAIAPGEIRTGLNEELLEDPVYMQTVIDATPLRRVGEVTDIAPAAVFLVSGAAGYITGASLAIDGGWGAA